VVLQSAARASSTPHPQPHSPDTPITPDSPPPPTYPRRQVLLHAQHVHSGGFCCGRQVHPRQPLLHGAPGHHTTCVTCVTPPLMRADVNSCSRHPQLRGLCTGNKCGERKVAAQQLQVSASGRGLPTKVYILHQAHKGAAIVYLLPVLLLLHPAAVHDLVVAAAAAARDCTPASLSCPSPPPPARRRGPAGRPPPPPPPPPLLHPHPPPHPHTHPFPRWVPTQTAPA
jgi:hypothetical protein